MLLVFLYGSGLICLSAIHDPDRISTIPPCPNHNPDPLTHHFLTHPTATPLHDLLDISLAFFFLYCTQGMLLVFL
ncbi:MAG: hypothetical protein S4CHLAM81_03460 [Chlamydiales bacterium]|nr:hypothetical protein [Chlamydiales bacterium]